MQYPVPQFIDVEDKIIGPFTIKQFASIFGGGIIIVALYRILHQNFFFYVLAVPIGLVSIVVSFGKFNGRTIYNTIPTFINFVISPKSMVFQKNKPSVENVKIEPLSELHFMAPQKEPEIVEPVQSQLRKLSMLLDQKSAEQMEVVKNLPKSVPENLSGNMFKNSPKSLKDKLEKSEQNDQR